MPKRFHKGSRSDHVISSLLLAFLAGACTPTTTVVRREVRKSGSVHRKIVLPEGAEIPSILKVDWEVSEGQAKGKIRWQSQCHTESIQPMESAFIQEETSKPSSNWVYTLAGIGALAGGVGLSYAGFTGKTNRSICSIEEAKTPESSRSCRTSEENQKERNAAFGLGLAIGGAGLVSLISGIKGFAHKPKIISEKTSVETPIITKEDTAVPCGKPGLLKGAEVRLNLAGQEVSGTVSEEDTILIPLPITGPQSPVATAVLKSGYLETITSTSTVDIGRVDLSPHVQALQARIEAANKAAYAEADAHEFDGSIHGDTASKESFDTTCTPSGKDLCFDAIDNDCDGVYDVGCGYQSGALQWTLAWKTRDDLDLHVIDPDGHHVYFNQRQSRGPSGLQLDVDCLGKFGNNCLEQNVENIFTPREKRPQEGTYIGWVEVFRADENETGQQIDGIVGGRISGKTFKIKLNLLSQQGQRQYFSFAIGKDRDKDGVIDRQDACPDQPGLWSFDRSSRGCPDSDRDGVFDKDDRCPREPGLQTPMNARTNGCPRKLNKVRLTSSGIFLDQNIEFPSGSSTLPGTSIPLLKDVASLLKDRPPGLRFILIEGHTDGDGERDKNIKLSWDRVRSVLKHLQTKEHVSADGLRVFGVGPDRPIADNKTPQGKAKNRRVELRFVYESPSNLSEHW